jgi:hypothetical protein
LVVVGVEDLLEVLRGDADTGLVVVLVVQDPPDATGSSLRRPVMGERPALAAGAIRPAGPRTIATAVKMVRIRTFMPGPLSPCGSGAPHPRSSFDLRTAQRCAESF